MMKFTQIKAMNRTHADRTKIVRRSFTKMKTVNKDGTGLQYLYIHIGKIVAVECGFSVANNICVFSAEDNDKIILLKNAGKNELSGFKLGDEGKDDLKLTVRWTSSVVGDADAGIRAIHYDRFDGGLRLFLNADDAKPIMEAEERERAKPKQKRRKNKS